MHRVLPPYLMPNENQLLKSDYDFQMYDELIRLVTNLDDSFPLQTIKRHYPALLKWIYVITPKLQNTDQFTFQLSTHCRWILSGRSDFPICKFCGKQFGFDKNIPIRYDYSEWCSNRCRQTDPLVVARTKATKFKNHGDENYCNVEQIAQTSMIHFGVPNPNQCRYVREKIEQTCLRDYGYKCVLQSPIVKMKIQQTNLDRRGVTSPLADPVVREKGKQTSWTVYGTEFPIQSDIIKERVKEGFIEHYGVDHNMKSPEGLQYWKDCFTATYGVDNPSKCPKLRAKMRRKYVYCGIQFDSAPELAMYIWLKDHGIEFEYQPSQSFEYTYASKTHLYFPDFKIEDQFIEIKGDQFFTEDGKITCPYRNKHWSDQQYQAICEQFEAKHQCMLQNNVKILRSNDYKLYLDYISQTYGKDYLKQFRVNTPKDA